MKNLRRILGYGQFAVAYIGTSIGVFGFIWGVNNARGDVAFFGLLAIATGIVTFAAAGADYFDRKRRERDAAIESEIAEFAKEYEAGR